MKQLSFARPRGKFFDSLIAAPNGIRFPDTTAFPLRGKPTGHLARWPARAAASASSWVQGIASMPGAQTPEACGDIYVF